jgi:DNA-binding NarL/FixJ family response regulator
VDSAFKRIVAHIRILIADDHPIVRRGLMDFISTHGEYSVCGEAEDGRKAVEKAKELEPDIVLLDVTMPNLNGIDAARQIKAARPSTEIMMFTAIEDEDVIRELFEAGVKSYILKTEVTQHLDSALSALAAHRPYFTPRVGEALFARYLGEKTTSPAEERLSSREREVLQLVAEGKSNKETAAALFINLKTVETHRAAIMRKLKLDSVAALVRYAIRNRVITA